MTFNKWNKYWIGWSAVLAFFIGALHPPFWAFVGVMIFWLWFGLWWMDYNTKMDAMENRKQDPPDPPDKLTPV